MLVEDFSSCPRMLSPSPIYSCTGWIRLFDVYACPILPTRVEVFMNVVSFFETSLHVGLPNLTTRVEVFMNAFSFFETSRCIGLPNFDDES
ncbi:hypothetical protein H5410_028014 [Solanum commersonii]|uniref:Uncharacterized protein n=1 Tax=Solanum commersonii TaxID=4109 RepID=A0A9J5Z1G2_SOLCO|nr:hypothetical protein H5410_028014 [Solanum commersonii]